MCIIVPGKPTWEDTDSPTSSMVVNFDDSDVRNLLTDDEDEEDVVKTPKPASADQVDSPRLRLPSMAELASPPRSPRSSEAASAGPVSAGKEAPRKRLLESVADVEADKARSRQRAEHLLEAFDDDEDEEEDGGEEAT